MVQMNCFCFLLLHPHLPPQRPMQAIFNSTSFATAALALWLSMSIATSAPMKRPGDADWNAPPVKYGPSRRPYAPRRSASRANALLLPPAHLTSSTSAVMPIDAPDSLRLLDHMWDIAGGQVELAKIFEDSTSQREKKWTSPPASSSRPRKSPRPAAPPPPPPPQAMSRPPTSPQSREYAVWHPVQVPSTSHLLPSLSHQQEGAETTLQHSASSHSQQHARMQPYAKPTASNSAEHERKVEQEGKRKEALGRLSNQGPHAVDLLSQVQRAKYTNEPSVRPPLTDWKSRLPEEPLKTESGHSTLNQPWLFPTRDDPWTLKVSKQATTAVKDHFKHYPGPAQKVDDYLQWLSSDDVHTLAIHGPGSEAVKAIFEQPTPISLEHPRQHLQHRAELHSRLSVKGKEKHHLQ
jgi:hypothetical protein